MSGKAMIFMTTTVQLICDCIAPMVTLSREMVSIKECGRSREDVAVVSYVEFVHRLNLIRVHGCGKMTLQWIGFN